MQTIWLPSWWWLVLCLGRRKRWAVFSHCLWLGLVGSACVWNTAPPKQLGSCHADISLPSHPVQYRLRLVAGYEAW